MKLPENFSERKYRLFTCACCRQIWHLLTERSKNAVEIVEKYADGKAIYEQLAKARNDAWDASDMMSALAVQATAGAATSGMATAWMEAEPTSPLAKESLWAWSTPAPIAREWAMRWSKDTKDPAVNHDSLIKEIFNKTTINSEWLTWHNGLIPNMTQRMYDNNDFSELPIVADALEEAGCTDNEILSHCRSLERHYLGCWVVDSILNQA